MHIKFNDGCSIWPVYNNEGEKGGVYCVMHKKEGMVNVRSKRCAEDGCVTHPVYNFEGEIGGVYCKNHNKHNMVDVESRRCAIIKKRHVHLIE